MRLDYDILTIVMSCARRGDVGRMMSTCRTLHHAGVPHFLHGSLEIKSAEQLDSLCEFMRGDVRYRSLFLRDLDLAEYSRTLIEYSTPDTSFFKLISEYAQHLEALSIQNTSTLAFVMSSALSGLNNLHKLTIWAYSEELEWLLNEIQAPIRNLKISFWDDWSGNGELVVDPAVICASLKDCLEELDVSFVDFKTSDIQYSRLTTLRVEGSKFTEIEHIVGSFPNLSDFDFCMLHDVNTTSEREIEQHRMLNSEARRRGCWISLKRLESDLLSLYMLSVQSTVRNLKLRRRPGSPNEFGLHDGPRLQAVLLDTQPSSLEFSLPTPSFDISKLDGLLGPVQGCLTTLILTVEIHNFEYIDPTPELVSQTLAFCAQSRLSSDIFLEGNVVCVICVQHPASVSSRQVDLHWLNMWKSGLGPKY